MQVIAFQKLPTSTYISAVTTGRAANSGSIENPLQLHVGDLKRQSNIGLIASWAGAGVRRQEDGQRLRYNYFQSRFSNSEANLNRRERESRRGELRGMKLQFAEKIEFLVLWISTIHTFFTSGFQGILKICLEIIQQFLKIITLLSFYQRQINQPTVLFASMGFMPTVTAGVLCNILVMVSVCKRN